MTSSLQPIFTEIDRLKDERELRSQIVPKVSEHFDTTRAGIFFFDKLSTLDPNLQKILKVALSIESNPVARYLIEHHAPVHEGLVTSPKTWKMICPRPDHWHVMVGPIVSCGKLVGAVGCTRDRSMPAFDTQNLTDLSGICLHLSIWATTARTTAPVFQIDKLTPRELQIVELVALGRTNAEIGQELWITENSVKQALKRMFRKLEVSSRAEMVAQLVNRSLIVTALP
ncbi:LuxR C-terminal-related transcriptional regulator [Chamaesiphon minutus]|uniref:Response regulator containing a CheY-like receiver domain and an HTH DNA-binding domain n=1 Tax=Chamaesiphon minutus (strain ATCC 27169 / PCC 6605) TaxID=1173020 RepID=K9UPJ3_CHAP6|nr:LuxR C-terminal-related transcriptional regulator [Chamaesiphon minutus]AFY96608.1 response regulator containing a CheY-like receiver domain and an HTH DNA-binding domain [Chamaesiphon minutus PCC 6605]